MVIFQIRRNLSHFSISELSTVIIKSQGQRLNSQEPIIWVKYSWIKCSHCHNSTSESIDKDWTFISTHHQRYSSPERNIRQWILQQSSFPGNALSPKWPRLRPLITNWPLPGWQTVVSQPQISLFPWVSRHHCIVSVMLSNHSHASFMLTNFKNTFVKLESIERWVNESRSEKT